MSKEIRVAFQGEHGAYSEEAIRQQFGTAVQTMPCRSFGEIFEVVRTGAADKGMLPVENSLAGAVSPAYDLLVDHDLWVEAEVILRVRHCLLAPKGTKLTEVKQVRSHYQALGQCERNLARMGIAPLVHYDTAGAARDLAESGEAGTAAIASALAGETYGLETLVSGLEDEDFNYTRFFVLGREMPERVEGTKTSIIFTTRHVPGALYHVLGALSERGLNMTKIESRPRRNRPWDYLFYVDFEGHEDEPAVKDALLAILKQASFLKVLGSYPAAKWDGGV
ncbi:MAG TPA: prephenate dehydratase [Anaerolineae bacterium]|nr:prephenate dehydratase [Anaerolineae bacterium]